MTHSLETEPRSGRNDLAAQWSTVAAPFHHELQARLHCAVVSVLHYRFSGSEDFRIGNWSDGAFETAPVVIDGDVTLQQTQTTFESVEFFAPDGDSGASCTIALWPGSGELAEVIGNCSASLDAVIQIDEANKKLIIHFRNDKHDRSTVEIWLSVYQSLAQQFADQQKLDQPIGQLDLLTPQLRETVLQFGIGHQLPSAYSDGPSNKFTFHRQFEKQVACTPNRTAVWAKEAASDAQGIQWDYLTLNRQANAIAEFLIQAGIQVEDTVGIVMDRRVCLLAALLGVFKAGGRYVALEPELPDDRLTFMMDDASVKYIITESAQLKCAQRVSDSAQQPAQAILNWDEESFQQGIQDGINSRRLDQNPDVDVHSRHGAYLIYTSGSTGLPKGVDVWHHSFVDLCRTFIDTLQLDEKSTGLGIATTAFDASICELFPPLLVGGKVGIGHKRAGANGVELSKLIDEVSATYMFATPTSLRVLMASGWKESPNLTVIAGGEAVSSLVCRELGPRVKRLINGYGPTETTVYATLGPLSSSQTDPVPIGPPIANSRAYVLDEYGQLLPPMVPGELFIGGQSPARGYLNRPELTADKFLTDPFVDSNGGPQPKIYATGDVVYWGHDGFLYYVGRNDHQVKLRGYRIELGEIETRLCNHPAVKDAVAMVREDQPGQQRLVAYVVFENRVPDTVLQDHLMTDMPDYMVPTWFVPLDALPVNANLKLDKKALPNPDDVLSIDDEPVASSQNGLVSTDQLATGIASIWSSILNRKIRVDDQVFRMGADSLTAVKFQVLLREEAHQEISVGEVFQYPTPRSLAQQINQRSSRSHVRRTRTNTGPVTDIAVVGLAGCFPGAPDVDAFWNNLVNGVESIREFSEEELIAAGVSAADYLSENYVARGTVLEDAYDFEPEFFGVTRSDAQIVSPQIRMFMKTAWEALEVAGYPVEPADHRIGVFAGCGNPNYLAAERHVPEAQRLQRLIGNGADFLATRTSYALGLTGPAIGIQTACSTSLVAVAHAVNAIRSGQCEMAIAGGSSCSWPMGEGYQHGAGLIYSADGHCRTFDHRASGTIFSQASGAVLLRPLQDAINAGDTIHAVIKGVGVNNDGARKGGYAAPSIQGQCEVIQAALDDAEISADQIGLVEAHGTATKIGDPIEVSGLKQAWERDTQEKQFCAIGSVKANVGHADAAAGIVGLLKVILSLKHKVIPPLVNYETPNPEIVFPDTPFYVNTEAVEWKSEQPTRFAAISSFGMGGTNAHLVVAEGQCTSVAGACDVEPKAAETNGRVEATEETSSALQLIPFSARTDESLQDLLNVWNQSDQSFNANFRDIAFTLQSGRKHFARRAFAIASDKQQLSSAIDATVTENPALENGSDSQGLIFGNNKAIKRKVVFLFTGQGAQYANMARDLYQREPVFREALDECDAELKIVGDGLIEWLFAANPACDINQTQYAQVALFSVSYAQAKLWQSWGVSPDAMIGHSIGEYAAAAIAGVLKLKDALAIVAKRGQLMQSMPPGSMLAVMHHDRDIQTLLRESDGLDLAVVNSRSVAVVAGPDDAIDRFAAVLDSQDVKSKKLHTSHAFHSSMMDPMLDPFVQAFSGVQLSEAKIPYLSNVSGTWITKAQATDPNYYAQQIRSTVKFAENLETLMASDDDYLFIELGPGSTLTQISKTQFSGGNHAAVATLPSPKQADADSQQFTWEALGRCWTEGLEIDWSRLQPETTARPRRVVLPTYCFNEQTYRAEKEHIGSRPDEAASGAWYNVPVWKQDHLAEHLTDHLEGSQQSDDLSAPENAVAQQASRWLVLAGVGMTADAIKGILSDSVDNLDVVSVVAAERYAKLSDDEYSIRPDQFEDYQKLMQDVQADETLAGVIHGWTLSNSSAADSKTNSDDFWDQQKRSTISLAWLSKAIGDVVVDHSVCLNVLTQGVADIDPAVKPQPANHCFLGAAAVIQKEYRTIQTKVIDLGGNVSSALTQPMLGQLLVSQLHESLLALDRGNWWKQNYDRVSLAADTATRIQNGSTIVCTGGLGGLSRNMALQLAGQFEDLKVVLLARNVLPPEGKWDQILAEPAETQAASELQQRIVDYRQLKSRCDVSVVQCDVSDRQQLVAALQQCNKRFGKIDLLLHTAGVLNDGVVATKTWEQLEPVLAAKSLAADVCCQYIRQTPDAIGSLVFYSSIASDIGLFGQFAYSAANNYLDGLCRQMKHQPAGGTRVLSVNWPAFRDVGMAVRSQVDLSSDAALQREIAENSFTVVEGTKALIDIVNNPIHARVVLSKQPFSTRLQAALEDGRSVALSLQSDDGVGAISDGSANVEDLMLEIWRQQFGNEQLTLDDDYFELGGDSLMAVGMIAQVEKVFGKMVPISHLINSPTPRKLIRKLGLVNDSEETHADQSETPEKELPAAVVCLKQSKSALPPLILLHGADGAVMFYREFANRLKTQSTIYGLESPFLSDPEFLIPDGVEQLAVGYVERIRALQPQGPYRLAGYSFGGVLAYEIARQLESDGEKIETLILYDIGNPALLEHNGALERLKLFWDDQEERSTSVKLFSLTKRIGKAIKDRTTVEVEHRVAKIASPAMLASNFWRHKKAREQHMAMEEGYVPEAIGCPVRVVSATGNSFKFRIDETMGWSGVADDLRIESTEGSHLELFETQYVGRLVHLTEKFLGELDE